MKSIILAILVATSAGPVIETASGATFEVVANTAELSVNSLGATQASANVIFQDPDKTKAPELMKVGVLGCSDGRGVIVLFDQAGSPQSDPHNWRSGGQKVFDGLGQVVCEIARVRAEIRRGKGWV